MRLTPDEKNKICQVVQLFCSKSARLYLYGSRTDDTKQGGDIDLLLIVPDVNEKTVIDSKIYYLLSQLKQAIGDQHIDFSVLSSQQAEADPFFQTILPGAILLF